MGIVPVFTRPGGGMVINDPSGVGMTVLLVTLLSSLLVTTTSPIYQDMTDLTPALDTIRNEDSPDVRMEKIFHYHHPVSYIRNIYRNSQPRLLDSQPYSRLRRGGKCMFNALAFNCDYKDAIGAANEASYWGSSSPGK